MKRENRNKLVLILILILPILIGAVIWIVFSIVSKHPRIPIVNLQQYVSEKPRSEGMEQYIEELLYDTTKLNSDSIPSQTTALIRDGSFLQREKWAVNYVEFIVDINSLEQSYNVSYSWTTNPDAIVSEWDTYITCINAEDAIFEKKGCTDYQLMTYGTNDPLDNIFPVLELEKYLLSYSNTTKTITVNLYGCREEAIIDQKKQADAWLKENIYHLDKYKVEYNTCAN